MSFLKKKDKVFNIFLIFILLQPLFDILSFLYLRHYIPIAISTYIKPLFIFGLTFYLLLTNKETWHKWGLYLVLYVIYCCIHFILLYRVAIPISTIWHEMRFLINTGYMICMIIILFYEYSQVKDKEALYHKFKWALIITMCTYGILLLIAVLTGTSALSYEYADSDKLGFKGWFDSASILGHAMSIALPFVIVSAFKLKQKWKYLIPLCLIIPMLLFGTKVPYYMLFLVSGSLLLAYLLAKFVHHEPIKIGFPIYLIIIMLGAYLLYPYLPVKYNIDANNQALTLNYDDYKDDADLDGTNTVEYFKSIKGAEQFYTWHKIASETLREQLKDGSIKPADTRARQLVYNRAIFKEASPLYKLFGIGYLTQSSGLALESDIIMSFFCFGIIGSILMLIFIALEYFKALGYLLFNLKKIDLETYALFIGISAFIGISIMAGYTFIYTNFAFVLVLLLFLLKVRIRNINGNPVMFIASQGGHLNELRALSSIYQQYDYTLVTEYSPTTKDLRKVEPNTYYLKAGSKDHLLNYLLISIVNLFKTLYLYLKLRPKVIVTTGTHTAVPMCYLGHLLGSKIIWIETFANITTKTLAGRLVYPIADTFIVQWPTMKKLYPKAIVGGWIY